MWLEALFIFAGTYALIQGVRLALTLRATMSMRATGSGATIVDEGSVPAHAREILGRIDAWSALGFEHAGWISGARGFELPPHDPSSCERLLAHPDGTWLVLAVFGAPERGDDQHATLVTHLESGERVETSDATVVRSLLALPEGLLVQAAEAASEEALLERHRSVAEPMGEPIAEEPEAFVARSDVWHERQMEVARAAGELVGEVPSFGWALRASFAQLRVTAALTKAREQRRRARGHAPLVPVAADLHAWTKQDALRARGFPIGVWLGIFAISGIAFAASIALGQGTLEWVAMLTGVVLFHELGHWLAMKARGYSNTGIFFVPFLGGAAVGHKERISTHDEMIVLLAGPLPGLFLGIALVIAAMVWPIPEWAHELGIVAIAVNGLNLFPIFPLDGGRVAHLLLFRGHPVLEAGFRVCGSIALAIAGIASSAWILVGLAAFLLIGIRHGWDVASAERALRARGVPSDREEQRAAIMTEIRERRPDLRLAFRILRARELSSRLGVASAGIVTRGAWLLVYGVCFSIVGLPLALYLALL